MIASMNAAAATTSSNVATPHTLDGIVAIVNDSIVTQSQLKLAIDRYQHQMQAMGMEKSDLTAAQISDKALQQLIDQQLILQIAKQQKITASSQDIDKAIARLAALNHLPLASLSDELKKEGITMSQFRKDLANQLISERIKSRMVAGKIEVTAADIAKFKAKNLPALEKNNQYHLLDFTLPVTDVANKTEMKQATLQAQQLIIKLKKGANVDTVGVNYDDLGWRNFAELPDLFVKPVSGLAINGVSEPIPAPNGIHVLKVLDIKSQGVEPTADQIKRLVWEQKADQELHKTIEKMRQTAYIKIIH